MILEARNIHRFFPQGTAKLEVLVDLNFSLRQDETVAIIGQSGSGKSTLLSLLAGLDRADAGKILYSGREVTHLGERELSIFRAKTIGIVFQQFHLMSHLTALENVSLPLEITGTPYAAAIKKSRDFLGQVGLGHRMDHYPHQLSGGEKQRVAIARALVIEPPILLADEPSGNLDHRTGDQVMKLLFELVRQKKHSLILVTHNEGLAKECSRQLQLVDGKLLDVKDTSS